MAKHLVPQYASSYGATTAATAYLSPANMFVSNATETNKRVTHRGADITISKWRLLATVNARTTTSTFTWFKNGSATSLAISVPGGTTGAVEDTTNSVSLTAGDTHSVRAVYAAEASALNLITFGQYQVETASAASPLAMATTAPGGAQSASTTSYHRFFQSSGAGQSSNDRPDHEWAVAGSFSGLFGFVSANSRSDATTLALYQNGSSAISVSVAAGVTGRFENTANSAALAVGDDVHLRVVTGAGTGSITLNEFGSHFTPTTAGESPLITGANSTSGLSGATFYHSVSVNGTESNSNWIARFDGVASRLTMRATVNTATTTSTGTSRKNGADGNQAVSLAAGVTGLVVDTTNTDSLTTGDLFNARMVYGTMPDNLSRFTLEIGKFAESTGRTGDASITDAADTVSSASVLPIAGAAGVTDAADTLSAAGTLALAGSASISDADDTLSAAGVISLQAAASITDADDTLSATGSVALVADASITDAADTLASAGVLAIVADAAITDADDTLSASGASTAQNTGALTVTDEADTVSAAGVLAIAGALAVNDNDDTLSAAGSLALAAAADITDEDDALAASGSSLTAISGALDLTDEDDALSSTASIADVTEQTQPTGGGGGGEFKPSKRLRQIERQRQKARKRLDDYLTRAFDLVDGTAPEEEAPEPIAEQVIERLAVMPDPEALRLVAGIRAELIVLRDMAEQAQRLRDDDDAIIALLLAA